MVNRGPLKDKTLQFEQDYIETDIKWGLKLGDDIFKKIEVKKAVTWLRTEINNSSKGKTEISLEKLNILLNEAFYDVTKRNKKKRVKKEEKINFKETELFKTLFAPLEKQSISEEI